MIKAIFFDIDGTLISFKTHTVPESTRNALKELKKKGIKIFIATGRPKFLIKNLDDLEFDGYITLNGAHCFTNTGEDIYKGRIPESDIENVIEYHKSHNYPFVFVHDNQWFITNINSDVEEICNLIEIPAPQVLPIEEAKGKEILQIMGYFPESADKEVFGDVLINCESMRWHHVFTDIICKGTSKSRGIDEVIKHYGIKLEETMAFGDGGNDIPMLRHTNISVAMGNASDKVKASAKYITTSVDEDGVINALKYFNII